MEVDYFFRLLKESISLIDEPVGLAFSGGLDSSVMAKLLLDSGKRVTGYVVGVKNSSDIRQARRVAQEIGLNLKVIILSEEEIDEAIGIQAKIIKDVYDCINDERKERDSYTPNAIPISFNLPLYFVAKNAHERLVVVSQGPDEMLGGYAKYQHLQKDKALAEMARDTQDLVEIGINQNLRTGRYWKKEFFMPYLDLKVVAFCLSLPYELRIKIDERKYLLRELASNIGIPKDLIAKKKAAQYGSGILDMMRKIAKKNGHHISWLVNEKLN
jgi:asparagine synthase (glutamine-hydrolysing)